MLVKCPKCRFKYEMQAIRGVIELSCVCERCGEPFIYHIAEDNLKDISHNPIDSSPADLKINDNLELQTVKENYILNKGKDICHDENPNIDSITTVEVTKKNHKNNGKENEDERLEQGRPTNLDIDTPSNPLEIKKKQLGKKEKKLTVIWTTISVLFIFLLAEYCKREYKPVDPSPKVRIDTVKIHDNDEELLVDDEFSEKYDTEEQVEPIKKRKYLYDIACEQYLSESDIEFLSKEELRLMRNWVYARHGYTFKDNQLNNYFRQYEWYKPKYMNETYIYKYLFNDIERSNVDLIKEREGLVYER